MIPKPPVSHRLYFLQQVVNAVPISSIYVLIAVGFSLVYGVAGRINLAFGEMATLAAYAVFVAVTLAAAVGFDASIAVLAAALILGSTVSALWGWATHGTIFRPLRHSGTQALLIATVGLAIFLRELMRLAQGSHDNWLRPLVTEAHVLARDGAFEVSVSTAQLAVLALTVVACGLVAGMMTASRFGRRYRACADDLRMAALVGIDTERVFAFALALGCASAGLAGAIVVLYYGTVSAYMGTLIGFKALVAALVGGLGSYPGAIVGGIAVGLFETLWSGYFGGDYKDVGVFALLAAVLVFRPAGLVARAGAGSA